MKKLLLAGVAGIAVIAAGSANAADLGTRPTYKAPPPVVAPVPYFSWTGCYIGAHIGGGWGRKDFTDGEDSDFVSSDSDFQSISTDTSGILGGGQVGCNYQFAQNWVIGIEGDISAADIKGSVLDPFHNSNGNAKTFHAKTDWLASVTGRVGWTWDRWMLYAKGGIAWAGDKYHVDETTATCGGVPCTYDASETRTGWTVGVGLEWAFWTNWSAKLEYDFYGFGHKDQFFTCHPDGSSGCAGSFGPVSIKQDINAVKFGINYRFGWGKTPAPVMARY